MSHISSDHPRESGTTLTASSERPDKLSRSGRRPVLPDGPREYHHFLRTAPGGWWRGALAVVLTCGLFLGLQLLTTVAVGALDAATGLGLMPVDAEGIRLTPALLAVTNVATGLMIPVTMGLQRLLFGTPARWLHSVHGRFRWRLAGWLTLVLVPVWGVYTVVLVVVDPRAAGVTGAAPTLTSTLTLLAVVLLTTPFQAAGEEYAARGLIARGFGSWFANPRLALVVSLLGTNVLFMLVHGAGDWTLALYYFVFGVACTLLTWRTGGLEAAVVLHAVNNTVGIASAAFLTSEITIDRSAGAGGATMFLPGAMMALTTAAVWWWSHRRDVARAADPTTDPATSVAMERQAADARPEAPSRD